MQCGGGCGILSIKKDTCANRCPAGAADRRLARLISRKIAATFGRVGGYFCVLLLSLPIEYPIPKQVKPKLSTAISPNDFPCGELFFGRKAKNGCRGGKFVVGWMHGKVIDPRRLPSFSEERPSRREKGGIAMVTYSDLFQFSIFVVALVGVCYTIFRGKHSKIQPLRGCRASHFMIFSLSCQLKSNAHFVRAWFPADMINSRHYRK